MAKPKSPLLSFGARGTIASSLTFQKRGRTTIVRTKPTPTDPESSSQLARRQVYRDAVADWNALSPAEKESWRGVCPGLTAYQCYMKTALTPAPPPPPPEEKTEEQIQHSFGARLATTQYQRLGQKLLIPNRNILKLGFWCQRLIAPTGDLFFEIRKVSDDSVILSKVWGDTGDVPLEVTYLEATFDTPEIINEEVRIDARFEGGDANNQVKVQIQASDVKADEFSSWYKNAEWTDYPTFDCAYRYKYYEVE